jgi:hypothetical protein
VRNQLTSIQREELSNFRLIYQKAPYFMYAFRVADDLRRITVTEVRLDNSAGKHQEKQSFRPVGSPTSSLIPEWVGPLLPPLTTDEIHHIASIFDPAKSSAGSRLYYATREKDSEMLATEFCRTVISLLFLDGPSLKWVTGRGTRVPVLHWRHKLNSL